MALTLLDTQRYRKEEFEKGVVETWLNECDISKMLPMETIHTVEVRTRRSNSVAQIGFRARGQAYGSVSGTTRDVVADAVYPMGAQIDIDKMDMRDKAPVEDVLATRTEDAVKGAAWRFNRTFIKGDHGTDLTEFEGLKVRIAQSSSSQIVYAGASATAALALTTAVAANTTATMQTFFDKMDAAKRQLDGRGKGKIAILTNDTNIALINACKRRLSLYKDTSPELPYVNLEKRDSGTMSPNSPVDHWDGIPIFDMGLESDQSTNVITTDTIGSDACYPIYFVRMGFPYVHGIEEYPLEVSKSFMTDNGVTFRTVIDWPVGLRHVHPKSIVVLKGVL